MTKMGFVLYFRRKNIASPNKTTATLFILEKPIALSPQKAAIINVTPAVAIIAITAGRKALNTVCKVSKLLYFIYNQEINVTRKIEGAIFPKVAKKYLYKLITLKQITVANFNDDGSCVYS